MGVVMNNIADIIIYVFDKIIIQNKLLKNNSINYMYLYLVILR